MKPRKHWSLNIKNSKQKTYHIAIVFRIIDLKSSRKYYQALLSIILKKQYKIVKCSWHSNFKDFLCIILAILTHRYVCYIQFICIYQCSCKNSIQISWKMFYYVWTFDKMSISNKQLNRVFFPQQIYMCTCNSETEDKFQSMFAIFDV